MKECAYCGRENEDAALRCRECGTEEFNTATPAKARLSELDPEEELVTLVSTQRLADADLILSRLGAAGIEGFIPDQFLMQTVGFNLNTFGYGRVQVRRKDLEKAKELLSAPGEEA
jgi:hypothetical protein